MRALLCIRTVCATGLLAGLAACGGATSTRAASAPHLDGSRAGAAMASTATAGDPGRPASALPPGWVAGSTASAPASKPTSLQRLMDALAPRRTKVAPVPVALADLPPLEVEPPPRFQAEPSSPTPGEPATELLIFDEQGKTRSSRAPNGVGVGVRVTVRDRPLGTIMGEPFYPWAEGGGMTTCGTHGGTGWRSEAWETVSPATTDAIVYERTLGWFDHQWCRGFVTDRFKATARPIAEGVAYVFRTSCAACSGAEREKLHVIAPIADTALSGEGAKVEQWGMPFIHAELSLAPGFSGSLAARVVPSSLEKFKLGGAKTRRTGHTFFGVEVTRAVGESEPKLVAWVGDAPPP